MVSEQHRGGLGNFGHFTISSSNIESLAMLLIKNFTVGPPRSPENCLEGPKETNSP